MLKEESQNFPSDGYASVEYEESPWKYKKTPQKQIQTIIITILIVLTLLFLADKSLSV